MPKCKSEFEDWLLSLQQLFSRCLSLAFFEFKTVGFFPSTASSLHSGQKENSWPASASFIPALELGRIAWNYQDRLKINHHINKHHKHHNNKKTKKTPPNQQRQKIPTKKWRKKTSNRQETFVKLYCNTLQLLKLLPFNRRPDKFMKKQSTNAYMETL